MPETPETESSIAVGEDHEPPKSTTDYYDTADLRLYRWGAVLCRQKDGRGAGWHLALPVGDEPPTTVSLPLSAGRPGRVPTAMTDLVTALRRDEPLQPITTLHTRLGPAELLSDAFGAMASAPPDVPPRDPPGPDDPAADAVHANLAKYARRFLLQDVAVRQGLPEGVHDMRVAARHLRSTLKTFTPLVDEQWAGGLRDELRWAATQLGPVRDTEVLLRRLVKHAGALQPPFAGLAVSAIEDHYPAALDEARAELLVALRSRRHLELLDRLVAAVADPPFTDDARRPCRKALPPLVQRAWKVLDRSVGRLQPTSAPEAWHDSRKKAKRALRGRPGEADAARCQAPGDSGSTGHRPPGRPARRPRRPAGSVRAGRVRRRSRGVRVGPVGVRSAGRGERLAGPVLVHVAGHQGGVSEVARLARATLAASRPAEDSCSKPGNGSR